MKKIKLCAICGAKDVLGSRDHLPPKAIFTKPRPRNLITVPACLDCNNAGSKHDEIFKTLLAFLLGQSPSTNSLYESAISTARKKFSRDIVASMYPAYLATSSGIIYDKGYVFSIKPEHAEALEQVIKRITAGLYYYHFGNSFIGKGVVFQIRFHDTLQQEMLNQVSFAVNRVGDGQFTYGFARSVEGTKTMSLWLYEFYERYWVSCGTLYDSDQFSEKFNECQLVEASP